MVNSIINPIPRPHTLIRKGIGELGGRFLGITGRVMYYNLQSDWSTMENG